MYAQQYVFDFTVLEVDCRWRITGLSLKEGDRFFFLKIISSEFFSEQPKLVWQF